jgi:hypothetical protein
MLAEKAAAVKSWRFADGPPQVPFNKVVTYVRPRLLNKELWHRKMEQKSFYPSGGASKPGCHKVAACGSKRDKRYDSTGLLTDSSWFIYRYCTD